MRSKKLPSPRPTSVSCVVALCLATAALLAACDALGGEGSEPSSDRRYYQFIEETSQETFVAATSDSATISVVEAQLRKPPEERKKLIVGPIKRGDGPYPDGYPWHFVPGEWTLADLATEVCDATPSYVSENVGYFVDEVGRYCPFGSRVVKEVEPPS